MSQELLAELLTQRVRRRERCGDCRHWQSEDGQAGECAEDVPAGRLCDFSLPGDGCSAYFVPLTLQWYDEARFGCAG